MNILPNNNGDKGDIKTIITSYLEAKYIENDIYIFLKQGKVILK